MCGRLFFYQATCFSAVVISCSGGTLDHPDLVRYACDLFTNVRFVRPVTVSVQEGDNSRQRGSDEVMSAVLGGRPLLCLAFDEMVVSNSVSGCEKETQGFVLALPILSYPVSIVDER